MTRYPKNHRGHRPPTKTYSVRLKLTDADDATTSQVWDAWKAEGTLHRHMVLATLGYVSHDSYGDAILSASKEQHRLDLAVGKALGKIKDPLIEAVIEAIQSQGGIQLSTTERATVKKKVSVNKALANFFQSHEEQATDLFKTIEIVDD